MALSYDLKTTEEISFKEFVEIVTKTVKKEDTESLIDCVEPLQKLSNNRTFLSEYINNELNNYVEFQNNNGYSAQTLMLHNSPFFYVRANAWEKLASTNKEIKEQEDLFFFLRAHDHNFSFLTVGYLNDGYTTKIWEYDNDKVIGYPNEEVELKFLEKTTLPQGKAMIYRESKDIHAQYPPEEYSVSLNIILNSFNTLRKEQYYFDLKNQKIAGLVPSGGTGKHLILELAKQYNTPETFPIIENIAVNHEIPYVRAKAYETLSILSGNDKKYWQQALRDNHKIVSGHAKLILETL
jgi:hypothetical protein